MAVSGSVAIWCPLSKAPPSTQPAPPEFEAHFNYWRIRERSLWARTKAVARSVRSLGRKKPSADFLEVGILLSNPQQVEEICFFVPLKIDLSAVEDCGPKFGNRKIAQGIFNEPLACTLDGKPGASRVELKMTSTNNVRHLCRVHIFTTSDHKIDKSQLLAEHIDGGTLFKITRDAINAASEPQAESNTIYFRIRAPMDGLAHNPFVREIRPADRLLLTGYEVVEYLDFRVNEARTLPDVINRQMGLTANAQLRKVVFLSAVPVSATMSAANAPHHKCRLLEPQIWENYVANGLPDGMIVYHWNKEFNGASDDYSGFIKLHLRKSSIFIIFVSVMILFLLGVGGNLFAAFLQDKFGLFSSNCSLVIDSSPTANSTLNSKSLPADEPK